jgi:phosphoribosylaminoimidazolecarboxamide formyltransferase/IMP cyclohydrolase
MVTSGTISHRDFTLEAVTFMAKIQRALISVSDKTGILDFARKLASIGVKILSTGGTAKVLRDNNISATDVSDHTGFPEMLDGRVKTLHPKIHGGLLGRRDRPEHLKAMMAHGIDPIDLVVVNLYPFESTVFRAGVTLEEAVENIDIGGPSMLRSAAKNFHDVAVVIDPVDYDRVWDELERYGGEMSRETRFSLAAKAFARTAKYDAAISAYLERVLLKPGEEIRFPEVLTLTYEKAQHLRYGENPHQQAAFYRESLPGESTLARARQIHGKEMSFNNYLDAHAALELVREFEVPVAAIIKHNNPCGVAVAEEPRLAYLRAKEADPTSAFGGVIAFNKMVDAETAQEVVATFYEVIIAPEFAPDAKTILSKKKELRLLEVGPIGWAQGGMDFKKVTGGLLLQDRDAGRIDHFKELKVVSQREPSEEEWEALAFAWKVAKHVKSNAIIFARDGQAIGIGAGQMSRIDSVRLAAQRSRVPIPGSVMASDGFFPFRDGIDAAAEYGIRAVIQPGGSIRDEEVIQAANDHRMAMVVTGMRHFRH